MLIIRLSDIFRKYSGVNSYFVYKKETVLYSNYTWNSVFIAIRFIKFQNKLDLRVLISFIVTKFGSLSYYSAQSHNYSYTNQYKKNTNKEYNKMISKKFVNHSKAPKA